MPCDLSSCEQSIVNETVVFKETSEEQGGFLLSPINFTLANSDTTILKSGADVHNSYTGHLGTIRFVSKPRKQNDDGSVDQNKVPERSLKISKISLNGNDKHYLSVNNAKANSSIKLFACVFFIDKTDGWKKIFLRNPAVSDANTGPLEGNFYPWRKEYLFELDRNSNPITLNFSGQASNHTSSSIALRRLFSRQDRAKNIQPDYDTNADGNGCSKTDALCMNPFYVKLFVKAPLACTRQTNLKLNIKFEVLTYQNDPSLGFIDITPVIASI